MANTLNLGNGNWATKEDSLLAYNSENGNFKPLPFDFTRASSGTVVNKDGLVETIGSGEPRIDFKDNTKGALLLEPTRSNLITNSNNLTTWNGAAMTRTLVDDLINPSNGLDASKLTQTSSGGYAWLSRTFTGNETFSAFVKKDSSDFVRLYAANNTVYFDIVNGTIETEVGSDITDKSIVNYGNGWFRISMSVNSTAASYVRIYPASSGSSSSGTNSLFVYGVQLEQGSYATSYIPTSGSAVTRSADVCSEGGNSTIFNNNSFTIFSEFIRDGFDTDSAGVALGLRNPSNSEQIRLHFDAPTKFVRFRDALNGFATIGGYIPISLNEKMKLSLSVNGSTAKVFSNGVQVGSDYTGITPFNIDEMVLNGRLWKVKDVRYYNTALTDQELIALTQ